MKAIPIDKSDYKRLIEDDCYYVDKTKVIEDLIVTKAQTVLYTRPRRFGKSLLLSTLYYFFDIESKEDNKKLFDNTYIGKSEYMEYFGKYPVIRLDFKTLMGNSYEEIFDSYKSMIGEVYSKLNYVYDSLKEEDKIVYDNIKFRRASLDDYKKSLVNLTRYLHDYYNEKVVVLIDEYDTAINDGYTHGFYDEIINFIQPILYNALKGNIYIQMSVLTGVLKVGSVSLFSKFNNVDIYDVMSKGYNEYFGFTLSETKELLEYYGLELNSEVKSYYDGYVFGGEHIVNPWSILKYASRKELRPYWLSTGSNKLVKNLLSKIDDKTKIEELIKGEAVPFTYDDSITYETLTDTQDINNLLNLLLVSGYVTYDREEEDMFTKLQYFVIPNKEVLEDFIRIVESIEYKDRLLNNSYYREFMKAFVDNNKEYIEKYFNEILPSLSYYDTYENFYHGYTLGLFNIFLNNDNFIVKSNREAGSGRYDVMIESVDRSVGIVIEFKLSNTEDSMEEKAKEGLEQIKTKEYYKELVLDKVININEYVIVFCGKKAIVR